MRFSARSALGCLVVVPATLLVATAAFASVDRGDSFAAVRVDEAPTFDAALSDPKWQRGTVATDFISMTTKKPAPLQTTAYVVYDSKNLYAAFRSEQRGVRITSNQTTNNIGLGLDDWVALGVDTSGNGSRIYYFFTTPRGVRYQKSTESVRYNPPWVAHAIVNSDGTWVAEIVVPLRYLRTQAGAAQDWRISVARFLASTNDQFTWAWDPRMTDASDSTWWPKYTGVRMLREGSRPQPYADVYGLAGAGRDRNLFARPDGSFAPASPRNYGFDATFPFTESMAVVGTLAPDFSNVETDQLVITPQEFQRRLTEYRPFFAQGADYLTPGLDDGNNAPFALLFYSPNIGEFNRGLKIEGTAKLNTIGALEAQGSGFDDVAFGFNHKTEAQDFRYFLDGVLANHTDGRDEAYQFGFRKANTVSGLEGGAEYAGETGSFVATSSLAHYTSIYSAFSRPNYSASLEYLDLGPLFSPADGFVILNDMRGFAASASAQGAGGAKSAFKTYDLNLSAERYFDYGGHVHEEDIFANTGLVLKDLFSLDLDDSAGTLLTYPGAPINGYPTYANGVRLPFNQFTVDAKYGHGTAAPVEVTYAFGPFATQCPSGPPEQGFCFGNESNFVHTYVQQFTSSMSRPLGTRFSLGLEYDGTRERPFFIAPPESQFLRRISLGESFGHDENVAVALRSISGIGGFAAPGVNLAVSYHRRNDGGNEIFVAYGTPAATATLNRLIVKYVLHFGGGAGT